MDRSIFKFIGIGVINTVVGTVIMFGAYNVVGLSYWISSTLNYLIGSVLSYILNKKFTFKNNDSNWKSIPKFIVNIVICYLLAYSFAKPIVRALFTNITERFSENIALLVGMILFTGFNYVGQRFFVFQKRDKG